MKQVEESFHDRFTIEIRTTGSACSRKLTSVCGEVRAILRHTMELFQHNRHWRVQSLLDGVTLSRDVCLAVQNCTKLLT
ncbi:hypothetical protein FQZ97_755910 [compost metagenome]